MRIVRLAEVGSTNTVAREYYDDGERDALWVIAERQIAGRGRLDRDWTSETGNLYATALLPRPKGPIGAMAFIAAVAVADTLADFIDDDLIALKWPNDALMDGRKVAGILCETVEDHVICGIGINIAHHPDTTRWPATHLAEHMPGVRANAVFERLHNRMGEVVSQNERQGWDVIRGRWMSFAFGLGREVSVDLGDKRLAGRFRGVGANGEFLLSTPSGTVPIVAGDVSYTG